ncbi:MAG: response regulator [Acidobacteriota bacterium]
MPDTGISILVVEDEQPLRSLLTEILSQGFQCASAESASEAIRLMESKFFHLALVDVGLPGMSGISLCRLIVNRSPRTVIVVVSGNTDTQSIAEAMKAGAADYITKPFNLSELLLTVERALGRHLPGAVA